jgi:hypothetical protein
MANQMYGLGRQAFLAGSIAILSDNIKVCLVSTASYTLSINTDQFLSDIPGGAIVATSGNLASKSDTLGVFNAATVTFTAVTGAAAALVVLYKDTGTGSTSPLIGAIDTGTGLPVTPNGGDITLTWDTGSNKIFKLREALKELGRKAGDFFRPPDSALWRPAPAQRIIVAAPLLLPGFAR